MPELVLKLGDNVIQTYVFDKEIMGIGRSRDNDVVIENLSVSRNHCRIRNQSGKFILTDLNSANGTYVNGVKVTKTEIVDGDVVSVGKHKLLFQNKAVSEEQIVVDVFGQDRTMVVDRLPQPVLAVTDGKLKGTEFTLTKFETSIGKAQDNDIVIGDDWFLSKKQAVIYRRGTDFEIHDLGGFRKTKVNGQQINEPHLLKPGDVIELGNTRCVFQFAGEAIPTGRVPQEMESVDSIFSSGVGLSASTGARLEAAPPPSTERDEVEESYGVVVEGPPPVLSPSAVEPAAVAPDLGVAEPVDTAPVAPSRPSEEVVPPPGSASQRRRKRDRTRELAAAAAVARQDASSGGSVYGVEEHNEVPAEIPENSPKPAEGSLSESAASEQSGKNGVPEPVSGDIPGDQAVSSDDLPEEARPLGSWSGGMTDEEIAADADLQREVALWEQAVRNKSAVIRRQAAKMLKKLTGRDYEI